METVATACAGCGLVIEGGTDGCQALFDDEAAREYQDVRFARHRRMVVDTYCLQHPDRYCASAISLAAHLTGMCIAVEHAIDQVRLNDDVVQRWLSRRPVLTKPVLPLMRGTLTIADLRAATEPEAHAAVAHRWATDTWAAYADLHGVAREWLALATG